MIAEAYTGTHCVASRPFAPPLRLDRQPLYPDENPLTPVSAPQGVAAAVATPLAFDRLSPIAVGSVRAPLS